MNALLDVLNRYPGLWSIVGPALAALLWAVVSGIFNTAYDRFSPHSDPEWAAALVRHPRWASVVSVMKTAGFNLPGLLRSLRVLFGGPLPKPLAAVVSSTSPPSKAALTTAIETSIRSFSVKVETDPEKTPTDPTPPEAA